jgi:hypothetical protein
MLRSPIASSTVQASTHLDNERVRPPTFTRFAMRLIQRLSQDFLPPQPPSHDQPPTWYVHPIHPPVNGSRPGTALMCRDSLSLNDEKAPLDNQEIREVTTPDFTSPQSNRGTMI